jgi:hypothetical protein
MGIGRASVEVVMIGTLLAVDTTTLRAMGMRLHRLHDD